MSEIVTLLTKVMEDVGAVRKADKNQAQGFNFRGIDAVVNACSPAFRKHGVVCFPNLVRHEHAQVQNTNGKTMAQVTVVVEYHFVAPDGSELVATVAAESMDSGDKATAKAMSVAYRTALLQTLCLPTDEIDPDAESFERGAPAKPAGKPAARTTTVADENGGLSKSQKIVLDKVLVKAGVSISQATAQHLGAVKTYEQLTRDDLGILLGALTGGEE